MTKFEFCWINRIEFQFQQTCAKCLPTMLRNFACQKHSVHSRGILIFAYKTRTTTITIYNCQTAIFSCCCWRALLGNRILCSKSVCGRGKINSSLDKTLIAVPWQQLNFTVHKNRRRNSLELQQKRKKEHICPPFSRSFSRRTQVNKHGRIGIEACTCICCSVCNGLDYLDYIQQISSIQHKTTTINRGSSKRTFASLGGQMSKLDYYN